MNFVPWKTRQQWCNHIAGKDSSIQEREAELAVTKLISLFKLRKDKSKRSATFIYKKKRSGNKNIYIITIILEEVKTAAEGMAKKWQV